MLKMLPLPGNLEKLRLTLSYAINPQYGSDKINELFEFVKYQNAVIRYVQESMTWPQLRDLPKDDMLKEIDKALKKYKEL